MEYSLLKEIKQSTLSRKITLIFLCSLPIIDMSNNFLEGGLSNLGLYIKAVFSIYIAIVLLTKKPKLYLSAGIIFAVLVILQSTLSNFSLSLVVSNAIGMFKYYYFYLIVMWLLYLDSIDEGINVKQIFYAWFVIIILSFLISYLTGTYNRTYSWLISTKSWYYAGNELSSLLMGLFPLIFYYTVRLKNWRISLVSVLSMIIVSAYMGTKTLYFGFILYLVAYLIFNVLQAIFIREPEVKRNLVYKVTVSFVSLALLIVVYPVTPVGGQMKDHGNIIESELNKPPSKVEEEETDEKVIEGYYPDILEDYPTLNMINMLLKNRVVKVINNGAIFVEELPVSAISGVGAVYSIDQENFDIQTEMDFFTVLFRYGIISIIILCIFFVIYVKDNIYLIINQEGKMLKWLTYLFVFLILMAGGLISGHVLIAPLVNIMFSLLFIEVYSNYKRVKKESL